jgi:hypothetical protein
LVVLAGNDRAVRISSAKLTRKIPTAAGRSRSASPPARDRDVDIRDTARYVPDHGDAPVLEIKPPGDPDCAHDNEQRGREAAGGVAQDNQDAEGRQADYQGDAARVA